MNILKTDTAKEFYFDFIIFSLAFLLLWFFKDQIGESLYSNLEMLLKITAFWKIFEYLNSIFKINTTSPRPIADDSNSHKIIIENFKSNPTLFIETHFCKSQSLVRNYLQKAFFEGTVREEFILLTLLIPKRKEIPVESLKSIFLALNNIPYQGIFQSKEFYENEKRLAHVFENYSPAQITNLFLRPFSSDFLIQILSQESPVELHITLNDIFYSFEESKPLINPILVDINNQYLGNAKIKTLRTKPDYDQASNKFINCVRSYYKKETDVITLYINNEPYLCIELGPNLVIQQISTVNNGAVHFSAKEEVDSFLNFYRTQPILKRG